MAKKEILNNDVVTLRVGETAADFLETAIDQTEQAIDIAEKALDQAETVVEKVVTVTKNNPFLIAGALLLGAGIGGFIAYKISEKRLSTKFDEELTEQIAAAKAYRSRIAKENEFETPEGAVNALIPDEVVDAVQSYQGRERPIAYNKPKTIDPRSPAEVVAKNVELAQNVTIVAKNDSRDWDYNAEIADRELNPNDPYVISFDEFNENAVNHEQTTMSYYAMDDTLADSQEKLVDNTDYIVSDDSLNRFGHGSGDPNVVYVRNERIDMDFEIIRINGSYQKDVLGMDPTPLQHSRRHPNRRSWRADE